MASTEHQPLTGIVSFDVPELLAPLANSISDIQGKVNKAKVQMMLDMHRDPVPQFSHDQIQDATQFLNAATDAMEAFICNFRTGSLKDMDEETITMFQEKTRESVRQLVLLLANDSSKFNGSEMKGRLVCFQEASQSAEIRERLTSLASFLKIFGKTQWLGQMTSNHDFEKHRSLSLALLQGLLNPTKTSLPSNKDVQNVLTAAQNELKEVNERVRKIESRYTISRSGVHVPLRTDEKELKESMHQKHKLQDLVAQFTQELNRQRCHNGYQINGWGSEGYQSYENNGYDSDQDVLGGYHNNVDYCRQALLGAQSAQTQIPNPLSEIIASTMGGSADASSNAQKLKSLSEVCTKLAMIFETDEQKRREMKERLEQKMVALKVFAEALNRVPEVLNRYILVRLGDIDVNDLTMLKGWITLDEATCAHKMLETFRDEAILEKAIRVVSSRTSASCLFPGSESVASAKEYLFVNSVGQACETSENGDGYEDEDDGEEVERNQAGSSLDADPRENTGVRRKSKSSHRQRKRRANFFASIPRTPSSGTHQS